MLGRSRRFPYSTAAAVALTLIALTVGPAMAGGITQVNLVSNTPDVAVRTLPLLVNAWGMTFNGTGEVFWVNDNGAGVASLFDRLGVPQSLVITIPPPDGEAGPSAPTGIVFNSTDDFVLTEGEVSRPARLLFDTEDGTISGWHPAIDLTNAVLLVDRSATGAVYKGLAMAETDLGERFLYATNFHSGYIEKFDADFNLVDEFTAADIPAGFAPFGIRSIDGHLFVTYAKQQLPDRKEDQPGLGNGYIVIFDLDGSVISLFAANGKLNSPWGMVVAPDGFGSFSRALLVGNTGDGHISAFDLATGRFLGQLLNRVGRALEIDGIWGLERSPVPTNGIRLLYFSAGPNGGSDGLIGTLHTTQTQGFQRRHFGALQERPSDGRNPGRAHH
jgi:uncharacterized protein (TIGR03118 family)